MKQCKKNKSLIMITAFLLFWCVFLLTPYKKVYADADFSDLPPIPYNRLDASIARYQPHALIYEGSYDVYIVELDKIIPFDFGDTISDTDAQDIAWILRECCGITSGTYNVYPRLVYITLGGATQIDENQINTLCLGETRFYKNSNGAVTKKYKEWFDWSCMEWGNYDYLTETDEAEAKLFWNNHRDHNGTDGETITTLDPLNLKRKSYLSKKISLSSIPDDYSGSSSAIKKYVENNKINVTPTPTLSPTLEPTLAPGITATPTPKVISTPTITLKPTSTPTPATYQIAYYGNGSTSGAAYSTKKQADSFITIKSNWFLKSGCRFLYWKDTNGDIYYPGNYFDVYKNTSFYAEWEVNQGIVTFDYNTDYLSNYPMYDSFSKGDYGNSLTSKGTIIRIYDDTDATGQNYSVEEIFANQKVYTLNSVIGELPLPSCDCFEFGGWSTARLTYTVDDPNEQGKEITISNGDPTCIISSNYIIADTSYKTLYAYWKPKNIDIDFVYYCDPEIIDIDDCTYYFYSLYQTDEQSISIPYGTTFDDMPLLYAPGYTFSTWYYEDDSKEYISKEYVSKETVCLFTESTTLYAEWVPEEYTLTFYSNADDVLNPDPITFTYYRYDYPIEKAVYPTLPTLEREGYVFDGWQLTNSSGPVISSGSEVVYMSNSYAIAKWTAAEIEITYNCNWRTDTAYGSILDADNPKIIDNGLTIVVEDLDETYIKTAKYNATYKYPTPQRDGYTFKYWTLADGTIITKNSKCLSLNPITLYANWTANTYTIYLNDNLEYHTYDDADYDTEKLDEAYKEYYDSKNVPIQSQE